MTRLIRIKVTISFDNPRHYFGCLQWFLRDIHRIVLFAEVYCHEAIISILDLRLGEWYKLSIVFVLKLIGDKVVFTSWFDCSSVFWKVDASRYFTYTYRVFHRLNSEIIVLLYLFSDYFWGHLRFFFFLAGDEFEVWLLRFQNLSLLTFYWLTVDDVFIEKLA